MSISLGGRDTHTVDNQAAPLVPYNVFEADLALREAIEREGGAFGIERLRDTGAAAGSQEALEHSERCERNEPRLIGHDRYGNRVGRVELDPSWHWLLQQAIEREIHSLPWRDPRPGAHVVRAGLMMLWSQANAGVMCPVSMTYSVIPALREEPDLAEQWEPRLTMPDYEAGALAGMAMTEKQGGSDVRANTTRAEPAGRRRLGAHRPQVVLLVSAVRRLPHARPGARRAVVLPDRGHATRASASSGSRTSSARARCRRPRSSSTASAAGWSARRAAACRRSSAWSTTPGSTACSARPRACAGASPRRSTTPATAARSASCSPSSRLMRNVLADLAVESEAATAAAMRMARAYDEGDGPFRRFATAVMKYWVCKRAPMHAGEALECLGGNGYVEESGLPRLLPRRAAQLDLGGLGQRGRARRPAGDAQGARGPARLPGRVRAGPRRQRAARRAPRPRCGDQARDPEFEARRLVEDLALALQASLLVRHAPPAVADAFCAGRLGDGGRVFGTLPAGVDAGAIVDRALAA